MNKRSTTIVFVGAGNMAGALIRGMLRHAEDFAITAVDVRAERLEELARAHPGLHTTPDLDAVQNADVVVLATKPQVFDRVLPTLRSRIGAGSLVVSIAAGIPTKAIEARLGPDVRIVRAMPNTPALVEAGATAICAGRRAKQEDLELTERIFRSVGVTVVVDESLLDAVTGLSGSGPAYIFLIIEALADAGVKVGLHRDHAQQLAAQTVLGSARLLIETGEHPGRLKDMVTSPGGTAIAGLHTLEAGGLRTTLIDAVESATERSRQLGAEAILHMAGDPNASEEP